MNQIIQTTTPNMNPRITRPSQLNIGTFSSKHPFFQRGGGSMFERIHMQKTKCLSCPNTR